MPGVVHRPLALGIGSMLQLCHRPFSTFLVGASSSESSSPSSTWTKPEPGWLKLNFDGSSKLDSRSASIGGVYRDHDGAFVLGYAEPIGVATSSVAELAALRRGLELAVANGWRRVWIEGDNLRAVDVVRKRARVRQRSQEDLRLWKEIERLLPLLDDDVRVSPVRRQGNCVAHGFAELGHGVVSLKVWRDVPPDEVLSSLQRDAAEGKCEHC